MFKFPFFKRYRAAVPEPEAKRRAYHREGYDYRPKPGRNFSRWWIGSNG